MPTRGFLRDLMDGLATLEQQAIAEIVTELGAEHELRWYRWRPDTIDLPAVWNWLATSPFEQKAIGRFRDHFNVNVRIGLRHADTDDRMSKIEDYGDIFRSVLDAGLVQWQPLGGKATRAIRTGSGTFMETFNEIPVFGLEMLVTAESDKWIQQT